MGRVRASETGRKRHAKQGRFSSWSCQLGFNPDKDLWVMQNVLQSCPTCEVTIYPAIPIVQWLETLPGLLTLEFPV